VLKELRYLLREARRREWIPRVPEIPFLGNYNHRDFRLDMDGFLSVLDELPEPPQPHRAMLLMALNTGQRRGDLTQMTWSQVRDDHVVYRSSKTRKQGIIAPLMPVTKAALEELRGCFYSPYIFVNPRSGKPIFDIRVALRSACERAGV
jgi:integrase